MAFSRIYVEITNCCNLACSFCHGTRRAAVFLSAEQFAQLAQRLRGQTGYLYFHVMGEPLLHPQLPELMQIAGRMGFRVVLTTNGTLLPRRQAELLDTAALHKVGVSLHAFEANGGAEEMAAYLDGCTAFGQAAAARGILVDYRLWNLDGAQTKGENGRNGEILARLHAAFPEEWTKNTWGWRLRDRVFLHYGEKFDWPDAAGQDRGGTGGCRALRDQIAVLCDGTVVPCCLDADGGMPLGNLFRQELDEILAGEAARTLREGFAQRRRIHPLCRTCGYAARFR